MAVAQALGSDMGMVMELESIVMLQIPSARQTRETDESRYHFRDLRVGPMKGPLQQEETLVTAQIETEDCFLKGGEPSPPAASIRQIAALISCSARGEMGGEAAVTPSSPKMPLSSPHRF